MRLLALLMAILAGAAAGATTKRLDDRAYEAIARILRAGKYKGEDAKRVSDALVSAAQDNEGLHKALVYTSVACRLIEGAGPYRDNLVPQLYGPDSARTWNDFGTLAKLYRPDGVLSAIRYDNIAKASRRDWLQETDNWSPPGEPAFQDRYDGLRRDGYRPDEAYAKAVRIAPDRELDGREAVRTELLALGQWSLPGYGEADAQKDVQSYFEGRYACLQARDTRSVAKILSPSGLISVKITLGLRQDLRHMMIPVQKVLSKALERKPTPVAEPAPASFDLRGTYTGKWSGVGIPGDSKDGFRYRVEQRGNTITITNLDAQWKLDVGSVLATASLTPKSQGNGAGGAVDLRARFWAPKGQWEWVEGQADVMWQLSKPDQPWIQVHYYNISLTLWPRLSKR